MSHEQPGGYRFLRIVLIVGASGFGVIGFIYLINGQVVPGLFALFLAAVEAAALPLFRKLLESSRPPSGTRPMDGATDSSASAADATRAPPQSDKPPPR